MAGFKQRESIDHWFDLNVDLDTRTIFMGSIGKTYNDFEPGVDSQMAEFFIKGMHTLNSGSSKPIKILMNNPGGDWYHGMAIYDSIKTSKSLCSIITYGYAMSMGSIILQAASERIMMPNSRFMIHFGSEGGNVTHTKIYHKWADESRKNCWDMENIYISRMLEKESEMGTGYLEKKLNEIFEEQRSFEMPQKNKRIKISNKEEDKFEDIRIALKELLNFDTILSPQQTIDIGLADKIFE